MGVWDLEKRWVWCGGLIVWDGFGVMDGVMFLIAEILRMGLRGGFEFGLSEWR
jgi:hypothetical protein